MGEGGGFQVQFGFGISNPSSACEVCPPRAQFEHLNSRNRHYNLATMASVYPRVASTVPGATPFSVRGPHMTE